MFNCNNPCRFCDITHGKKIFDIVDEPINCKKDFFILPTIGPMVEGWSLIIPKEHGYSMKKHFSNKRFKEYTNEVVQTLNEKYKKKVIVFEHGATNYGSLTACGTNHAHLHILPFEESLLDLMKVDKEWKQCDISDINNIVGDNEYLLYSELEGDISKATFFVSIVSKPESQYFRKLIAQKLGIPESYDYKTNLNIELAKETHKILKTRYSNE